MTKLLIGADPEIFLFDEGARQFISAHDLIPGTKQNPHKIKNGAIQVDGVALEFNITPAHDPNEFIARIFQVTNYLKGEVYKKNKNLSFSYTPTATFEEKYFEMLPETAKLLGCEPDYNAYTGVVNPRPKIDMPFRTASGHIHLGWLNDPDEMLDNVMDPVHLQICTEIVQQLDIALFLPSLLFDFDRTRQILYGAPGSFRPKPYGVEYRVLSNKWVSSPKTMRWVFENTQRAFKDYEEGAIYNEYISPTDLHYFGNITKWNMKELKMLTDFCEDHKHFIKILAA